MSVKEFSEILVASLREKSSELVGFEKIFTWSISYVYEQSNNFVDIEQFVKHLEDVLEQKCHTCQCKEAHVYIIAWRVIKEKYLEL